MNDTEVTHQSEIMPQFASLLWLPPLHYLQHMNSYPKSSVFNFKILLFQSYVQAMPDATKLRMVKFNIKRRTDLGPLSWLLAFRCNFWMTQHNYDTPWRVESNGLRTISKSSARRASDTHENQWLRRKFLLSLLRLQELNLRDSKKWRVPDVVDKWLWWCREQPTKGSINHAGTRESWKGFSQNMLWSSSREHGGSYHTQVISACNFRAPKMLSTSLNV